MNQKGSDVFNLDGSVKKHSGQVSGGTESGGDGTGVWKEARGTRKDNNGEDSQQEAQPKSQSRCRFGAMTSASGKCKSD